MVVVVVVVRTRARRAEPSNRAESCRAEPWTNRCYEASVPNTDACGEEDDPRKATGRNNAGFPAEAEVDYRRSDPETRHGEKRKRKKKMRDKDFWNRRLFRRADGDNLGFYLHIRNKVFAVVACNRFHLRRRRNASYDKRRNLSVR